MKLILAKFGMIIKLNLFINDLNGQPLLDSNIKFLNNIES